MGLLEWFGFGSGKQKAASAQPAENLFREALFRFTGNQIPVDNIRNGDPKTLIENGYASNGDVYAVINLILKACTAVPLLLYQEDGKKGSAVKLARMKQAKLREKGIYIPIHVLTKDVTEVESHPLLQLYDTPNPMQTFSEFKESVQGFYLCTGNGYMYRIAPDSGPNAGKPIELWPLFPQATRIIPDESYPGMIRGYELLIYGSEVPASEVEHVRNWNPIYEQGNFSWMYGMSPLYAGRHRVQQGNDADQTVRKILKNSGLEGVFTPKEYPADVEAITPDQGRQIETKLNTKYSDGKRVGVVSIPMEWHQIGLSPVDMALLDAKLFTLRDICNLYGVNSALLNDPENKTYNNMAEAREALYTNAAMPANQKFEQRLNRLACTPYQDRGRKLYFEHDYSVVPELQKDTTELYKAIEIVTFLTPDEKRAIFNYAETGLPEAQQLYMDSNLLPLGDAQSAADAARKELKREGVDDYA